MEKKNFREILKFYLIDINTIGGKAVDIFILLINFLVCFLFVLETYPQSDAARQTLWTLEIIIVMFFVIEYLARLYAAKNRIKQILNIYSIIDFFAILPTLLLLFIPEFPVTLRFLVVMRVFRVFRVFRFLRFTADPYFFFGTVRAHVLKVVRLILTILIIFFVSSGLFWAVENPVNPDVSHFGDAFYFSVVSLTTVGFGDIVPLSSAGRWITTLAIISGIIIIPWQVSQIVKEWVRLSDKQRVVCKNCGLRYHDKDASHCKSCGEVIYQEFDGH